MSDDIDNLKRDYRNIEAPSHLATRIKAAVADRPSRHRSWMPAFATAAVAIAVVLVTPLLLQQQQGEMTTPRKPSLSMLSRVARNKPSTPVPSLSSLRSVKTPPLPSKPKLNQSRPRSFFDTETDVQKETDYA